MKHWPGKICPNCGQEVLPTAVERFCASTVSPILAETVRVLASHKTRLQADQIAAIVYQHEIDGGGGADGIRAAIKRYRHELELFGLRLDSKRGPAGGYRLVTL